MSTSSTKETTQLGMNPDDGGALMNGQTLPDGSFYMMQDRQQRMPVMMVGDTPFGDPVGD